MFPTGNLGGLKGGYELQWRLRGGNKSQREIARVDRGRGRPWVSMGDGGQEGANKDTKALSNISVESCLPPSVAIVMDDANDCGDGIHFVLMKAVCS